MSAAEAAAVAEPVAEVTTEGEAEEMIVTGSRIKTSTSFAPSAPVEVIDRKQLEYSGATNLTDVIQYLTIAQGSGTEGDPTVAGTSSVNLRGLGAGATLVLINGRRINPSAGGVGTHFQDIGTIPLAAVERLEILKGGASAIYGADAVGGVINIITRKNWDGVRVEVDGQTTDRLDQQDYNASGAFGSVGERSRVLLAASYQLRTELTGGERDFTRGKLISAQGNPFTFVRGTGTVIEPGGCNVPGSMREQTPMGEVCAQQLRDFNSILGNFEQVTAFGSAEYDLTAHTTAFGELTVSRMRTDSQNSPSFIVPPPLPIVPADHVDNVFGEDVQLLGRPLGAADGPVRNSASDDTFRGVLGLKGDLEGIAEGTVLEDWEWELFATAGISRYSGVVHDILREPFQDALNSCSDPADLSGCFNPFESSRNGTGTPNRDAVIDSFVGTLMSTADHALQTYNGGMSGSLFELPGGDVGIAFGAEVRHESRDNELDHDSNEQRYAFILGNTDAAVSRNVYGGYLELRWPLYDGIEVQTAGRLERYTDTDSTPISPSAGFTITPAEIAGRDNVVEALRRLQFRGHITSAFHAPNVYQSFPGFAVQPVLISVPSGLPLFVPAQGFGNPDLAPERALAMSAGFLWQPVEQLSLMTDVWHFNYKARIQSEDPQQIVNESYLTGVQDPRIIGDLFGGRVERIQVTTINVDGSIITNGLDFGVMTTFDGGDFGGSESDWGELSAGAQGTYTMNFLIPFGEAGSRVTPTGTLPPADCDGEGETDHCQVAGKHNTTNSAPALPRWKVNFPIVWTYEGHMASAIAHYISGLDDDIEPNADGSFDRIAPWVTFDVLYGYTIEDWIGEELSFRVGILNVIDAMPPAVNGRGTPAYVAEAHDPRGRMVYGKLITEF